MLGAGVAQDASSIIDSDRARQRSPRQRHVGGLDGRLEFALVAQRLIAPGIADNLGDRIGEEAKERIEQEPHG